MKRIARLLLAAAMLGTATIAHAATVHVFAEYIGTTSYATPSQASQDAYAAFLSQGDIDFGVFYGPSSAGNFGFTHADYAKSAGSSAGGAGGYHIFVYKTARWTLLKRYSMSTASNKKNSADACVVEEKTTGEQFIFLMPSGTTFPYVNSGSAIAPVTGMRSSCQSEYPNAKLIVGVSKTYGLFDGSKLGDSIVAWGCTQARDGTSGGAIYAQNHESRTTLSAASVSWLTGAAEPAATATVTYRQQCVISFEDWDGTPLGAAQTVYAGEDATPPADPTREGYTFTGWSGSYQNVQASATLTAQYAINTYTVRFLDWDGSVLKSETVEHGSDATPPADPTRTGWRFTGWQGDYTGITAATDITATYVEATAVTHWVTFLDWDNTPLLQQEVVEGEDATPPADPDNRPGWHFTSWQGNYTAVMQDETVTAVYAINSYVVTFEDWDGTELKTETVEHGSDATPPADPDNRTGWHFTGWNGVYQNVQSATTVTAQYEIDTFTVTFQYTNGVVIATQTVNYQAAATPPANPAPIEEDTVFYRWDGSYSSITEDTTVTAVFVPNVIEIGTGAEFAEYMASSLVSLSGVTFALTNDISMSGVTYTRPSGDFNATLDGRGHTLTRLSLNKDRPNLIQTLKGTVRDLRIAGYTSPGNVGGTAVVASASRGGTLSGVVLTNCTWSLPSATPGTAGFIYETLVSMTTITNCWLIDCKVIGNNATRGAQVIGGFVAKAAQLKMVDCHVVFSDTNVVSIGNGIPAAGAFIGQTAAGVTIERCSSNARVKVASSVATQAGGAGGFVGIATSSGSPVIRECANFGTVESTVNYPAGGFIGDAGSESGTFSLTFNDNFNYGAVSSPIAAGGLIGRYRGVVSQLRNSGNSGVISSEAGFAGGLVGQIRYNDENRTWRIRNVMQAGAISTMSGCAGLLVGCIEESDLAGLSMVVSNAVIAGSAAISDGGQAGLLIGGRDITAENEIAFSLDETSRVLASNASLAHYYDKANAPASLATAPDTITASALVDNNAKGRLNAAATAEGWMPWVQGHDYPELSLFGEKHEPGLILVFY